DDLTESLQQQTATADVLKVISRSTFDLQVVLNTLVESAARLCEADMASIARQRGTKYYLVATHGFPPGFKEYMETWPMEPGRGSGTGRVLLEGKPVHIIDALADPEYTMTEAQKKGGWRTMLAVPLLREGIPIGVLHVARTAVRPFTDKQIELIETFADQAVIAIENVRLFDEVQARTRELTEALEQQTATAEVLGVISSSPGELQPVFQAMLANAVRVIGSKFGTMYLRDGEAFRVAAMHGAPRAYFEALTREPLFRPGPETALGRTAITRRVVQIADLEAEAKYRKLGPRAVAAMELAGVRTVLSVPMLKDNELFGTIAVYRAEVRPSTDKQIELVQTFAAQAVIAIENTRLLNELRESLQQQTATADVLKVISRSTFDLQSVLRTLVESAARLCDADSATIARQKDGVFYRAEAYGFSPEFMELVKDVPVVPERGSITARALLEGKVIHVADVLADPDYTFAEAQKLGEFRTILGVPMLREGI